MRCLIVGAGKTGTTALVYAVAQAMGGEPVIHFEDPIAGLQTPAPHTAAKVLFEDERPDDIAAFGAKFDRRILLVRDPRDNLISHLLYAVATHRVQMDDPGWLRTIAQLLQRKQKEPASVDLQEFPQLRPPSALLNLVCATNQALAAFAQAHAGNWFILRYEDMVAGRLDALSAYLGMTVRPDAKIDPTYQRVARTKGAGDWRHWFTRDDVAHYRPLLDPLMAALGYADDWSLATPPLITPEHSWVYFERLVRERRQFFGMPPLALPTPDQLGPETRARIGKADVINRLVRQFGFKRYLEYNKLDGGKCFSGVVCDSKTLAFIPEHAYLDGPVTERLLQTVEKFGTGDILTLPQLLERHAGQGFDIILYDPVHVRPEVDLVARALPALLNPGGILIVHDCNPEKEAITSVQRCPGAWVGETYKAFALLRHYNPGLAFTVDEDFGCGLVWNNGLVLDYPVEADLTYQQFDAQRASYTGLMSYHQFLQKTASGKIADLFAAPAAPAPLRFQSAPPPAPRMACQLFWRGPDEDFCEELALTLPIVLDGSVQVLHFTFPAGVAGIERLRFDPADGILALRLASLELISPKGALMWRWDADAHAGQDWRAVRFCEVDGATLLLTTGSDPQFHPALPASVRARLGAGCSLSVVMTPQPPLVGALLGALEASRQEASHE
ncbi:hypothetical protein INH39_30090 [Massilia violaceinigra]|uniref:Sulfotransferase family protein n=1 Tax=Massilia violaceinigra TaxID=2045208 RepID=A0ABY4A7P1_9BURK|nr:class I SAM-dependent methyltransferase [Massilia violaceinigra]UOD29591.1 hypothetical protein INH39_30090 [Massilia violaceinigra]